jgi:hypothetical protein
MLTKTGEQTRFLEKAPKLFFLNHDPDGDAHHDDGHDDDSEGN